MARRKRSEDAPPIGAPAWMLTYGDLVTQVLAFFVLLFAFSNVDAQKFDQSVISLKGAFGVLTGGRTVDRSQLTEFPPERELPNLGSDEEIQQLATLKVLVEEKAEQAGFKESVTLSLDERGLVLRFADSALFDSGKADHRPEAVKALDQVADILTKIPNEIRVEGHTDNRPISTAQFPSNWELSMGRAGAVVRYLQVKHEVPPDRLAGIGYGEYRPVAPNDSDRNRQLNRRVDIVILRLDSQAEQP
jgi:chemotaxis protein MotB